jgi:hypothetical protein
VKSDAAFLADLAASDQWRQHIAHWIAAQGYDVVLPPTVVRPDASQRRQFRDDGDLLVEMPGGLARVEVKAVSLAFTGRTDFPLARTIVDEAYKLTAVHACPLWAYVLLAKDRQHAALAFARDRATWTTMTRYDKRQARDCTFVVAPVSTLTFVTL